MAPAGVPCGKFVTPTLLYFTKLVIYRKKIKKIKKLKKTCNLKYQSLFLIYKIKTKAVNNTAYKELNMTAKKIAKLIFAEHIALGYELSQYLSYYDIRCFFIRHGIDKRRSPILFERIQFEYVDLLNSYECEYYKFKESLCVLNVPAVAPVGAVPVLAVSVNTEHPVEVYAYDRA